MHVDRLWHVALLGSVVCCAASHDEEDLALIVREMRERGEQAEIQAAGCEALSCLAATEEENRVKIAEAGGIELILAAMRRHCSAPAVQAAGCRALADLAYDTAVNMLRIPEIGGVEAILAAMRGHLGDPAVQTAGCAALEQLVEPHDGNRVSVAEMAEAVLDAMRAHGADSNVQVRGCTALASLALPREVFNLMDHTGDGRVTIARMGSIEAIVAAMNAHSTDSVVQAAGCDALMGIAYENVANIAKITELRGIEAVLAAMRGHIAESTVQSAGCDALSSLAHNNTETVVKIAALGGFTTILAAMRGHMDSSAVLTAASHALANLVSSNAENRNTVHELGGADDLRAAILRHAPKDRYVGSAALAALQYLLPGDLEYRSPFRSRPGERRIAREGSGARIVQYHPTAPSARFVERAGDSLVLVMLLGAVCAVIGSAALVVGCTHGHINHRGNQIIKV